MRKLLITASLLALFFVIVALLIYGIIWSMDNHALVWIVVWFAGLLYLEYGYKGKSK